MYVWDKVSLLGAIFLSLSVSEILSPINARDLTPSRGPRAPRLSKRVRLTPENDPGIRLQAVGPSNLVILDTIKVADVLVEMIGQAWKAYAQAFEGYHEDEPTTASFSIAMSTDPGSDWWLRLQGYVGIAMMQRVLVETLAGEGDIWTGPFDYDFFTRSDTRLQRRVGQIWFRGNYESGLGVSNSTLRTTLNNQTTRATTVAPAIAPQNSSLTTNTTISLGDVGDFILRLVSTGPTITTSIFVNLIFEALYAPIWQKHEASDLLIPFYPLDESFELVGLFGYSLSIRLHDIPQDQDPLTFGDLNDVLHRMLRNTPDLALTECKVDALRAVPDAQPFLTVRIRKVDNLATTAASNRTVNIDGFRQSGQQAAVASNGAVLTL